MNSALPLLDSIFYLTVTVVYHSVNEQAQIKSCFDCDKRNQNRAVVIHDKFRTDRLRPHRKAQKQHRSTLPQKAPNVIIPAFSFYALRFLSHSHLLSAWSGCIITQQYATYLHIGKNNFIFFKKIYVTHFNLLHFDFLMVKIKKITGILLCTSTKT